MPEVRGTARGEVVWPLAASMAQALVEGDAEGLTLTEMVSSLFVALFLLQAPKAPLEDAGQFVTAMSQHMTDYLNSRYHAQ